MMRTEVLDMSASLVMALRSDVYGLSVRLKREVKRASGLCFSGYTSSSFVCAKQTGT